MKNNASSLTVDTKVLAVLTINNRCYGHKGIITDIKKRWFGKPVYIIDGKYKTTEIARVLDNE